MKCSLTHYCVWLGLDSECTNHEAIAEGERPDAASSGIPGSRFLILLCLLQAPGQAREPTRCMDQWEAVLFQRHGDQRLLQHRSETRNKAFVLLAAWRRRDQECSWQAAITIAEGYSIWLPSARSEPKLGASGSTTRATTRATTRLLTRPQ